jgi:hypothetical protein
MIDRLVEPTWKRFYTLEKGVATRSLFQLRVGSTLLSLSNLEKRICGIKYINEAIRTVRQAY